METHSTADKESYTKPKNDIVVIPSVLKNYYNIPEDLAVSNSKNLQGIAAFSDYFSLGALSQFISDQKLKPAHVSRIGPDCAPFCVCHYAKLVKLKLN